MALRPLGHFQPLGLRPTLGRSVQRALKPPGLLSPAVRSPLFVPLLADDWLARWSNESIEETAETAYSPSASVEQSTISPIHTETAHSNQNQFSPLTDDELDTDALNLPDLQRTHSDVISTDSNDSEATELGQEAPLLPTSQKQFVNEEQSHDSSETSQSQYHLSDLPVSEIPKASQSLPETEGSAQAAFNPNEADVFEVGIQTDRSAIASQDSEFTKPIASVDAESEPQTVQAKQIVPLHSSELSVTEVPIETAADASQGIVNEIQTIETSQLGSVEQYSSDISPPDTETADSLGVSEPLSSINAPSVIQKLESEGETVSTEFDLPENSSRANTSPEALSTNPVQSENQPSSAEVQLPHAASSANSETSPPISAKEQSINLQFSGLAPAPNPSSNLGAGSESSVPLLPNWEKGLGDEGSPKPSGITDDLIDKAKQDSVEPSQVNQLKPSDLELAEATTQTTVDDRQIILPLSTPTESQLNPPSLQAFSESNQTIQVDASQTVAEFQTSDGSNHVQPEILANDAELKVPVESHSEQRVIQREVLDNAELLSSNLSTPETQIHPSHNGELESLHHTPQEISTVSTDSIQAQSFTASQIDFPLTVSQSENRINLEDLSAVSQSQIASPVEQKPWQEQSDFQPQIENEQKPQAVSETLISTQLKPVNSQFGEVLISPFAVKEASTNPSSTDANKIDDEQFEQLAQMIYRMMRSRYRIEAERYQHSNSVHSPWLNTISIRASKTKRSDQSDLMVDRQLTTLVQEVYRSTCSRLKFVQERLI